MRKFRPIEIAFLMSLGLLFGYLTRDAPTWLDMIKQPMKLKPLSVTENRDVASLLVDLEGFLRTHRVVHKRKNMYICHTDCVCCRLISRIRQCF